MISSTEEKVPISVYARIRPVLSKPEKAIIRATDTQIQIESLNAKRKEDQKIFHFDKVFEEHASQQDIYESCKDHVENCFQGINISIFAYGQTSTGKTFTVGSDNTRETNQNRLGLIPRACEHILNSKSSSLEIEVSFIEIYQEKIQDLLAKNSSHNPSITIREESRGTVQIIGTTKIPIHSMDDVFRVLELGSSRRSKGETNLSAHSSRSHAIFTLYLVEKHQKTSNPSGKLPFSKIHLVDLAGSERIKKSGVEGMRFKESIKINSSLLALGNVINALSNGDENLKHVPFRDSKLTRILQDALGGNSKNIMIACASPLKVDMNETINTLRYAERARKIRNELTSKDLPEEHNADEEFNELNDFSDEEEFEHAALLMSGLKKKSKLIKELSQKLQTSKRENQSLRELLQNKEDRLNESIILHPQQTSQVLESEEFKDSVSEVAHLYHQKNITEKQILNEMFKPFMAPQEDHLVSGKSQSRTMSNVSKLNDNDRINENQTRLEDKECMTFDIENKHQFMQTEPTLFSKNKLKPVKFESSGKKKEQVSKKPKTTNTSTQTTTTKSVEIKQVNFKRDELLKENPKLKEFFSNEKEIWTESQMDTVMRLIIYFKTETVVENKNEINAKYEKIAHYKKLVSDLKYKLKEVMEINHKLALHVKKGREVTVIHEGGSSSITNDLATGA